MWYVARIKLVHLFSHFGWFIAPHFLLGALSLIHSCGIKYFVFCSQNYFPSLLIRPTETISIHILYSVGQMDMYKCVTVSICVRVCVALFSITQKVHCFRTDDIMLLFLLLKFMVKFLSFSSLAIPILFASHTLL